MTEPRTFITEDLAKALVASGKKQSTIDQYSSSLKRAAAVLKARSLEEIFRRDSQLPALLGTSTYDGKVVKNVETVKRVWETMNVGGDIQSIAPSGPSNTDEDEVHDGFLENLDVESDTSETLEYDDTDGPADLVDVLQSEVAKYNQEQLLKMDKLRNDIYTTVKDKHANMNDRLLACEADREKIQTLTDSLAQAHRDIATLTTILNSLLRDVGKFPLPETVATLLDYALPSKPV